MVANADPFGDSPHIRERVQDAAAQFLWTELKAGLALVDLADTSSSRSDNERRRALALEAYDVVTERLARTGTTAVVLTDDERAEITKLCSELGKRLGR